MYKRENNYVFIDSQNVNLAIRGQGWILDWYKFGIYLKENYGASKIFLFLGYLEDNENLYTFLRNSGYTLIFKPTLKYKDGTTKGNCDAELVLQTMIEKDFFNKAVIVSGDGDFYCLVEYLLKINKLKRLLIPNKKRYSALLARFKTNASFMNDLEGLVSYQKKRPQ